MRSLIAENFIWAAAIVCGIVILIILLALTARRVSRANRDRQEMLERLNGSMDELNGSVTALSGSVDEIRGRVSQIRSRAEDRETASKVVVLIDDRVRTERGQKVLYRAGEPAESAGPAAKPEVAEKLPKNAQPDQNGQAEPVGTAKPAEPSESAGSARPAKGLAGLQALISDRPEQEASKAEGGSGGPAAAPPKFMDRSCGTDKNGRTYTEDELRKLIR